MHVWERAKIAKVGDVVVACCDDIIAKDLRKNNIEFVMTKKNHKSGSDRVYEAYKKLSKFKKYDHIINLQGDIPNIKPSCIKILKEIINKCEMATLVTEIKNKTKIDNTNIVKVVLSKAERNKLNAIYFSRLPIPMNAEKYYEHIGIYAYTISTLKKFVNIKNSLLEKAENLEQLRALENNINIEVGIIKDAPFSIDTPEDFKKFNILSNK